MHFKKHWELEGRHAFLGASKHHWTEYDMDKVKHTWENQFASMKGTRMHHVAKLLIQDRVKLPTDPPTTLALYVNDAIGFRMTPEVALVFNENLNAFGTADAIGFWNDVLRIHDLKTGKHVGHPRQLEIYAAFFCAEYKVNPYDIEIITRIYQFDTFAEFFPDPAKIKEIMDWTRECDKELELMKELMLP